MWFGGNQCRDVIAADEAADIGGELHVGARRNVQAEIARLEVERLAQRGDERRPPQLPHR